MLEILYVIISFYSPKTDDNTMISILWLNKPSLGGFSNLTKVSDRLSIHICVCLTLKPTVTAVFALLLEHACVEEPQGIF